LNCEVIGEARNGEEAFKIALEEHPDLIITDIKMPIMDGLELCKKVNEVLSDTVIILLSAYEDFDYARTAIQYGVEKYYLKPLSRDKINDLINEIRVIYAKFEKKRNLYTTLYYENVEEKIFDAIKEGDVTFFENYFGEMSTFFNDKNINQKELGVKYIDILFRFFKEVGVNSNVILKSKERVINDLFSLKTRRDIELYIQKLFMDVMTFTSEKKDTKVDFMVEFAKKYIQDCYSSDNLSISDIAGKLNITSSYLGVIFHQSTGINIISYIKQLRIEKACELLRNSMLTIVDISEKLGFQDPHYFSNVFKKNFKITPSEYRNLNNKCKREGINYVP